MQVHRSHNVEDNVSCDFGLGSRVNQIFLVNRFPPKPLDIAISKFASKYVICCREYLARFRACP